MTNPLHIELSPGEVLADLAWPDRPPGRWFERETAHIDRMLGSIERLGPDPAATAGGRASTPRGASARSGR